MSSPKAAAKVARRPAASAKPKDIATKVLAAKPKAEASGLSADAIKLAGEIPSALSPPAGCRFHTRCPHVMPICRTEEPPLRTTAVGHKLACHLTDSP